MSYDKALKIVQGVIVEQLGCKETEVSPTARMNTDLGANGLDIIEIVLTIEEKFGIEVSDEFTERISTVRDFALIATGEEPESTEPNPLFL